MTATSEVRQSTRSGAIGLIGAAVNGAFGFVLTTVIVRTFGADGSGALFSVIGLVTIVGAVCCLGADTGLMWAIPRSPQKSEALLPVALLPTVGLSVAVAVVGLAAAGPISRALLDDGGGVGLIRLAFVGVPVIVASTVLLAAVRATRPVAVYVGVQFLFVPIVRPVLMIAAVLAGGGVLLGFAGWLLPIAAALIIAIALIGKPRKSPNSTGGTRGGDRLESTARGPLAKNDARGLGRVDVEVREPLVDGEARGPLGENAARGLDRVDVEARGPLGENAARGLGRVDSEARGLGPGVGEARGLDRAAWRLFWGFALPRAASVAIDASSMWVGVLLTGALSTQAEAGVFAAVGRYALAGLLIMQGLRVAIAPQLSRLLGVGRRREAAEVYRRTTLWIVLLSWPAYALLAVFAPAFLALFGREFRAGAGPMAVLAVAMLVNVGVGLVQTVLLMSGNSRGHLLACVAGLALNVVGCVVLVPGHGALGAAIAWSLGIVVENVVAAVLARRALGEALFGRTEMVSAVGALGATGAAALIGTMVAGRGSGGLAVALAVIVAGCLALLADGRVRAALKTVRTQLR
ncbi:hypothetical protein GCM10010435_06700 [Winogradskya consettensis]|uniref:Polysaccharide biosynthesis protein C-terminal domain-containing protein n=1 Tax=Winogradskya consettensis TaxID=113560 RepID=A0A919SRR6_9ACTN|nr:MATE family efflux transporter [Actinoplanes consettensis]GIM75878.1 hypothetical protein Aco04nite_47540 [Actinoplanes consettensis]